MIYSLRYIFKYHVKIELIFVYGRKEAMFYWYNIGMIKKVHCLQFAILVSFILQNFLDCYSFSNFKTFSLQNKYVEISFILAILEQLI